MSRRRAWVLSAALGLLGASAACRDAAPPPGASTASTRGAPGAGPTTSPAPNATETGAPDLLGDPPALLGDPPAAATSSSCYWRSSNRRGTTGASSRL